MKQWALLSFIVPLMALDVAGVQKRIDSHLILSDHSSAIEETKQGITMFPDSKELHGSLIRVLSESGRSLEALRTWKLFFASIAYSPADHFALIEALAWGVLKDCKEGTEIMKLMALMGAYLTHDARATEMLQSALVGPNAMLRSQALRLSTRSERDPWD